MGKVKDAQGREQDDRFFKAAGTAAETGPYPRWVAKKLTHEDLTTAGTTQNVLSFSVPANTIIHLAAIKVETDFAGGGVTALTAALGISGGDVDAFVEEVSVFTGATNDTLLNFNTPATALGTSLLDGTNKRVEYYVGTSAIEVDTTFVSTTANVNALTAGSLTVMMLISNPFLAYAD